ncbi:hypothetical protein GLOIN_2v1764020 [Rhizophagus clarus]|nr:hypothetical protein GLOIN_2v1764020 [Rhizophagus clarus]
MVNRLWCKIAIPILWKNPWCYNIINYDKKNHLFEIITSYLPEDILTSQGIQLPSFSHRSLLFDYLSFCKSINTYIINSIISLKASSKNIRLFLQREFYLLFMKKCPKLKHLDMRPFEYFYFPEAELHFVSLSELICNTYVDSSYLYGLARISQNIQRMIIINNVNTEANPGIAKLIEVQKNLKYFEWKDYSYNYCPGEVPYNSYKEILIALKEKADTINHLKLYFRGDDDTLPVVLPEFRNLKSLIMNNIKYSNIEELKKYTFNNLEIFKIDFLDLKAASIIIENSGRQLKKILIEPCEYVPNFNEDSLIYIRKIYENCPSVEYLSLTFSSSKKHFIELEKLLEVCQNLRSLILIIRDQDIVTKEELLENDELLKILIRSKPTNLREIGFFHKFKYSLKALEEFFEKWRGHALSVVTSNYIYRDEEDHVKLFNKYKNNGIIKNFSRMNRKI